MLEHEESDQSRHEDDEQRNVSVHGHPVMEESSGILKENPLKSQLGRVEEEHAEDDDRQDEGDNGHSDFPTSMGIVVTNVISYIRGPADQHDDSECDQHQSSSDVCDVSRNAGQEVHQSHPEQSQPESSNDEGPKCSQETVVVLAED